MLTWLGENGAGCDCEVMLNTAAQWEEIVGYLQDLPLGRRGWSNISGRLGRLRAGFVDAFQVLQFQARLQPAHLASEPGNGSLIGLAQFARAYVLTLVTHEQSP